MNKERRRILREIVKNLRGLKTIEDLKLSCGIIEEATDSLEKLLQDEQMALDSVPDNMQYSTKADDMQDNIDDLCDAGIELNEVVLLYENLQPKDNIKVAKHIANAINHIINAIDR